MQEINATNASAYLRETGRLAADEPAIITELSGGVSNLVLLIQPRRNPAFVVKQARAQLRVPQPWFCGVERVLREIEVLRICQRIIDDLPSDPAIQRSIAVMTPGLLFEDRSNFLYAMSAAPIPHTTWKQRLLARDVNTEIAAA